MDTYGAEFKLDVGLYRLESQVACQRYRQKRISANLLNRVADTWNSVKAAFSVSNFAPAVA